VVLRVVMNVRRYLIKVWCVIRHAWRDSDKQMMSLNTTWACLRWYAHSFSTQ
jgi:hypothetical protein